MTERDANILIILGSITEGGAQKQATLLYAELLSLGFTVSLALMEPAKAYKDSFNKDTKFKIIESTLIKHYIPYFDPYFKLIIVRKNMFKVILDCFQLMKFKRNKRKTFKHLLTEKYNILIPFSPPSCRLSIALGKVARDTHVFFNHRGGSKVIANSHIVKEAKKLNNRFHLLSNAQFSIDLLKNHFRISTGIVLKNFVIDKPVQVFKNKTKTILLHVANYFPEKDYQTFLLALAKLKKYEFAFEAHIYCRFYKKSHYKSFIESLADLDILNEVVLFSSGENPQESLSLATMGILSTKSEGCSNTLIEYLQYRLPIVTTNIPANRELLDKEYHEYLFEVGDVDALVYKIQSVVEDLSLKKHLSTLSDKSLSQFKNNNSFQNFVQYINLLHP